MGKIVISAISGSHGFIGRHMSARLSQLGRLVQIDRDGLFEGKADWIFDCGAYGNLFGQNDKKEMLKANVVKLGRLLKREYDSLVYISTSSVSLKVQTDYSRSKKEAEKLLKKDVRRFDVPAVIVRPYTIIGSGEPDIHLIPKLIESCLSGKEMPFVSEPKHDFLDVRDLVEALILVAQNADEYKGQIFNIGSGLSYSNQEVKNIVEDIVGETSTISKVDSLRSYDTKDWVSNNSKINKLGWKPKYTLRESIKDMVADYLPGI